MKKLDRHILISFAFSAALTLLLAPLSPAADFTDEELHAFQQELKDAEKEAERVGAETHLDSEMRKAYIKHSEESAARHQGHPLNIIFEHELIYLSERSAIEADRAPAERRKLEKLDALLSRYGDCDYYTPYGDLASPGYTDPERIIREAAARAASIEAQYNQDYDKVYQYVEFALDYMVRLAERRRSRWPSVPPPPEPPPDASEDEKRIFAMRKRSYHDQRDSLKHGVYLDGEEDHFILELFSDLYNWNIEYPDHISFAFRLSAIAEKYAGTRVGGFANQMMAYRSQGILRALTNKMRTSTALDDLVLTAPHDPAPAPDAAASPAPPSRLIPLAFLALAALFFAASIYTFRRKRPSPEIYPPRRATSADKGHTQ